jgi:hypothetical protein
VVGAAKSGFSLLISQMARVTWWDGFVTYPAAVFCAPSFLLAITQRKKVRIGTITVSSEEKLLREVMPALIS